MEIGNPQLQTLKIIQSLNEKFIDIKKSDYLPTVAAFGTYQLQTQFDGFSEFSLKPTSFVGLNATWNIFNGGRTVSYTHLRAHETVLDLVCRLLLEKKTTQTHNQSVQHNINIQNHMHKL